MMLSKAIHHTDVRQRSLCGHALEIRQRLGEVICGHMSAGFFEMIGPHRRPLRAHEIQVAFEVLLTRLALFAHDIHQDELTARGELRRARVEKLLFPRRIKMMHGKAAENDLKGCVGSLHGLQHVQVMQGHIFKTAQILTRLLQSGF